MSGRWSALQLIPVIGAAWVFVALARVRDVWFVNDPEFSVFWATIGLLPFVLCFVGLRLAIRAREMILVTACATAAALLLLPGFWLSSTSGEGTLYLLTLLPLYTWAVVVTAVLVGGIWFALA